MRPSIVGKITGQSFLLGCLCAGLLLFSACGSDDELADGEFEVKGTLRNTKGEMMRLMELTADSLRMIDSMPLDNKGSFIFRHMTEGPGFFLLGTAHNNFVTLLMEDGEYAVVEGDAMQLSETYTIQGSPGSQLVYELNRHTRNNYRRSDSLLNVLKKQQLHPRFDSVKSAVDTAFIELYQDQQTFVRGFVRKNASSLASLLGLYQLFGGMRMVNEREDGELFEQVDHGLSTKYPENQHIKALHKRVGEIRAHQAARQMRESRLDSGFIAPPLQLNDPAGQITTLSSFRGKTVLLHFWASWSPECTPALATYKSLFQKYGSKGFSVFSISLDKDRQRWEQSLREHRMNWPQASDLMEWKSPVVDEYNLARLPSVFLIAPDGRILLKRPTDEQLINYLQRYYKF